MVTVGKSNRRGKIKKPISKYNRSKYNKNKVKKVRRLDKRQSRRQKKRILQGKFKKGKTFLQEKRYSEKELKRRYKLEQKQKKESNKNIISEQYNIIYRYSVAYFNAHYDKTFRAEVYSHKQNKEFVTGTLINALNSKIRTSNKGLQKMFYQSSFIGFEDEEMGTNDSYRTQLNRIYVNIS